MTTRGRIDELTLRVKELDNQSAELLSQSFALRTEREELIAQMILEDKVLSNTDWELLISGDSSPYLEYTGPIDTDPMQEVIKLARTDWHCWFELADGIRLQFDDNEVSLTFKEPRQLMPFVKKHNLLITGTGISDKLAKLKREVATLEDVCHQFNL